MNEPVRVRRIPTETEAIQFTGTNHEAMIRFLGQDNYSPDARYNEAEFWCEKADRWIELKPGMWVLKELDGKGFYPCAEVIFTGTYEVIG